MLWLFPKAVLKFFDGSRSRIDRKGFRGFQTNNQQRCWQLIVHGGKMLIPAEVCMAFSTWLSSDARHRQCRLRLWRWGSLYSIARMSNVLLKAQKWTRKGYFWNFGLNLHPVLNQWLLIPLCRETSIFQFSWRSFLRFCGYIFLIT